VYQKLVLQILEIASVAGIMIDSRLFFSRHTEKHFSPPEDENIA
jgi:hypothetical protein